MKLKTKGKAKQTLVQVSGMAMRMFEFDAFDPEDAGKVIQCVVVDMMVPCKRGVLHMKFSTLQGVQGRLFLCGRESAETLIDSYGVDVLDVIDKSQGAVEQLDVSQTSVVKALSGEQQDALEKTAKMASVLKALWV